MLLFGSVRIHTSDFERLYLVPQVEPIALNADYSNAQKPLPAIEPQRDAIHQQGIVNLSEISMI
jgi:hypothetical protein